MAAGGKDEALVNRQCLDEVTCPVCYEPLVEPVVFPCAHEVCKGCFHRNLSAANFCCPICRQRISSWARRRIKNPVDDKRKRQLEMQRNDVWNSPRFSPIRRIAKEGELHKEYLEELRMVEKERKAEEDLGRAEALRLAGLDYVETDRTYAAKLTEEMEQEERSRKELEELDRKYAESLIEDQSHSRLPTPTKPTKVKTILKKKKTMDEQVNQLPITIWCTPKKKEDNKQIETDYKIALQLQQQSYKKS